MLKFHARKKRKIRGAQTPHAIHHVLKGTLVQCYFHGSGSVDFAAFHIRLFSAAGLYRKSLLLWDFSMPREESHV